MVKNFYLAILLFISSFALAQVPQGINYQGVARDSYGAAISNTVIAIQFKIHQGSPSGTVVFSETHPSVQTDTFGLYSVVIGSVSSLSSVNWSLGSMYIEVDINGSIIATTQLQSVPYALYAASAGNSGNNITSVNSANTNNIVTSTSSNSVTVDLATVGTATTVGSSTSIPQITVDQYGRVINTTQLSITGVPSGASSGQVLGYNGSAPTWTTLPTQTIYTAGTGIDITGGVISNTATVNISGAGTATVTGTYPSYTVNTPASTTYSAGTGIDITGGVISNTATSSLPTPTVGSLLYSNSSNSWTPTNPSNISSDGNSISVTDAITGTAATFSSSVTSIGNPVLQVTSNSSTGYAIKVDANSGAAIVANSNGPYAINGNIRSGSGNAMEGDILNGANGNAVAGYIDNNNSTGNAGYFENTGTTNTSAVLKVVNTSGNAGHSAEFSGGKGVVADSITATNLTIGNNLHVSLNPGTGKVLTSDALGNATWQTPASGGLSPSLTSGYIFVGNSSNLATGVAMSGDATLSNSGALTLANSGVTAGTYPKVTVDSKGRVTLGTSQIISSDIAPGAVNLSTQVSGVLPTTNGGMGANMTAGAIGAIPYATSTTTYGTLAAGAAGQILTSNGAGTAPTWTTLPAATVTGATNGLSLTTGSVSLGGTLTGNTTINQGANNMTYSATTGNFQISNTTASTNAFGVTTAGTGSAGTFTITNGSSSASAIVAGTSGSGPAIMGTAGTGPAIYSNGPLKLGGVILDGTASAGNNNDVLVSQGSISPPKWQPLSMPFWSLSGNILGGSGYFLGTKDAFPMVIATTNTTTAQPIIFQTNGPVERMRVDATGNVGIGTNAPNYPLEVTSTNSVTTALYSNTGNGHGVNVSTSGTGNAVNASSSGTGNSINANANGTSGSAGNFVTSNASNGSVSLSSINNGTGGAGAFSVNNSTSGSTVLTAGTTGMGNAGSFNITNGSNSSAALQVSTSGLGYGINVSSNTGSAIYASNTGGANTISGINYGSSGNVANFVISNASSTANVINAVSNAPGAVLSLTSSNASGSLINASTSTSTNTVVYISSTNTAATQPALVVSTSSVSTANSANFNGGKGLQTDNFTMTNTAGTIGAILTATNTTGGAAWLAPQQPVDFSATYGGGLALSSTTQTVTFLSTTYNNGGGIMSGVYTPPTTGVYHIDASLELSVTSATATGYIMLNANGVMQKQNSFFIPSNIKASVTISADILVTSTSNPISISIITSNGIGSITANNYFNGHLVR